MSKEELMNVKIMANGGRICVDGLTDKKWQEMYQMLKTLITPHNPKITRLTSKIASNNNFNSYDGDTEYQRYCLYVNDVLKNIKNGKRDWCFFSYQITELLKFKNCYDNLKTKFCDGYWEVWLA